MDLHTDVISGLCTAAQLADANALAVKLGFGAVYTVPCSAAGLEPATHCGFQTWARPAFDASITTARTATDANLLLRDGRTAVTQTTRDRSALTGVTFHRGGFDAMLQSAGLKRVAPPDLAPPPPVEPAGTVAPTRVR